MRAVVLLLSISIMAGCQAPLQPRLAIFDPAEYAPYGRPGSGAIEGQAFLTTRGGSVIYGAGRDVHLNPVTTYSTEHYQRAVVNGERIETADVRAGEYTRTVVADGEGRFRFEGLPAGDYYIFCTILWEYPRGDGYLSTTGGTAHARASVREGEVVKVILRR